MTERTNQDAEPFATVYGDRGCGPDETPCVRCGKPIKDPWKWAARVVDGGARYADPNETMGAAPFAGRTSVTRSMLLSPRRAIHACCASIAAVWLHVRGGGPMPRPSLPARARRIHVNLTLTPASWKALQKLARAAGVSASQLVEIWVSEKTSTKGTLKGHSGHSQKGPAQNE